MSKIKVSVIIPIYNVEEYIEECLDSLVNQTLKDIEVLMVNDGSTDSSGEIAAEYADKYENFHLLTKPNGGQGQARNYAIPLAKGEYIAFVDPDDYISLDAYEKLYAASENGAHDIITGNVKRFNSKRKFNSGLHKNAIIENIKSTHITKNPELIYDTAIWNKLFKLKFWKENNIEFPEGVLYEDIPVAIISHLKSKSTAVLEDVIYHWRERDGQSKSVTQKRTEITNFTDRLHVLKIVDKFMEENNVEKTFLYHKYFRWLDLDFKLYINKLDQVDEDYINQFIPIVQEYIKPIPKYVFNDLRAIDRIKYYFIEKGNLKSLLEVLDFEKNKKRYLEVVQKGDKYLGKFPFKGVPEEYFEMTKELNTPFYDSKKINKIKKSMGILDIKGYCYIRRVNFDRKSKVNLKAKLVNTTNGGELPVVIENMKIPELTQKFGVRTSTQKLKNRLYNYDWAGYHIKIDLNDPKFLELGTGEYKVIINLQMPGINRDIILGSSNRKPVPRPYLKHHNNIQFKYNARGDLRFLVKEQHLEIIQSYYKDSDLYLEGWLDNKTLDHELFIHGLENNVKISLNFKTNNHLKLDRSTRDKFPDADGFTAVISKKIINSLDVGKWAVIYYRNGQIEPLIGNEIDKKKIFNNHLINFYVSRQDGLLITKSEIETYLKELNWENDKLKISACLNKNSLDENQKVLTSRLRCVSKKQGAAIFTENESKEENGHVLNTNFIVKTKDKMNNNLFLDDIWEFYVDYITKSGTVSHKIRVTDSKNFKSKNFKTHTYKPVTSQGYLSLKVTLLWPREANTRRKREALERYVYPLLRLLPVNKKRIIFESYWRNKYNCNPRYLYEYIDKNYPEYECIWVFNDESIKINGKGKKVRFRSLKYFYYMATAKYFINNVNFPDFYNKRKKAVEIQTMHGTPLKKIGLDGDTFKTKQNLDKFIERCKRWDYLILSSDRVADITKKCFMFDKEFLRTGYPRIDEIFRLNTPKTASKVRKDLKIPENKKVILYAPTWRFKNKFDLMLDLEKMKEKLGEEYVLLLRPHHLSAKGLKRELLNDFVIDVTGYGSIEKLYIIADVLITDYSSVMFDYAVLNKPMIFFTYDLDLYKNNLRGFYLDFEKEAPGPIVSTSNEVIEEILNLDNIKLKYNNKIEAFHKNYCQYEKGNACESVFKIVFKATS